MKVKTGFLLTELGNEMVAVPTGEIAEQFRGVIRMNKTAVFVWKGIEAGQTQEEIANSMLERYDSVDYPKAFDAVGKIIRELEKGGILE